MERIFERLTSNKRNIMSFLPYGIYFSLYLAAMYSPAEYWGVNSFNYTIGQAVASGISVSRRIVSMYGLAIIPALVCSIICIVPTLTSQSVSNKKEGYGSFWCICGAIRIVYEFLCGNAPGLQPALFEMLSITAAGIFYIFDILGIKNDSRDLQLSFFSMGLIIVFRAFACSYVDVQDIACCVLYIGFFLVGRFGLENLCCCPEQRNRGIFAFYPLSWMLVVLSCYYEIRLLLQQRETGIVLNKWHLLFVYCLLLVISLVRVRRSNFPKNKGEGRAWYFPLITGFAMLSCQPPAQFYSGTDLFEFSNAGAAVYGLFQYHEIPILENFDAHFLSGEIEHAAYATLSGDIKGALFLGYSLFPLEAIILFFLLRRLVGNEFATCIILLFPWKADLGLLDYAIPLVLYLVLLKTLENKNVKWQFALWLACAICIFFQLDTGLSAAVGVTIAYAVTVLLRKQRNLFVRYIISGAGAVLTVLTVIFMLLYASGVNPISRIFELIDIASSNDTWAYTEIGSQGSGFAICYVLVPAIVLLLIFAVIFRWRQENWSDSLPVVLLGLSVTYFFNFPRSLVRHSFWETGTFNSVYISGISIILIVLDLYYLWSKRTGKSFREEVEKFVLVYAVLLAVLTLSSGGKIEENIVGTSAVWTTENYKEYDAAVGKPRFVETDETKAEYYNLKVFFDATISPQDTFLDFTRNTLLYSLTERKKPVYVNQSPELVSGEYSQKCFIEECEQFKPTYALFWADWAEGERDGISFNQKYYLISEYISRNYRPLCHVGKYAIWCRNNRYEDQLSLVMSSEMNFVEKIGIMDSQHMYVLNLLPYVWGTYGIPAEQIVQEENTFTHDDVALGSSYYILATLKADSLSTDATMPASLQIKNGQDVLLSFDFLVQAGENQYAFRVSCDPLWYLKEWDSYEICTTEENDMQILDLEVYSVKDTERGKTE